jgi:hypothetical protein
LRQVGGFLWELQHHPQIKLTATTIYNWNIVASGVKHLTSITLSQWCNWLLHGITLVL